MHSVHLPCWADRRIPQCIDHGVMAYSVSDASCTLDVMPQMFGAFPNALVSGWFVLVCFVLLLVVSTLKFTKLKFAARIPPPSRLALLCYGYVL